MLLANVILPEILAYDPCEDPNVYRPRFPAVTTLFLNVVKPLQYTFDPIVAYTEPPSV